MERLSPGRLWLNSWDAFGSGQVKQRMCSHGPVRGYNRQDFLAACWETSCTDPRSGTGTPDGTAEVQWFQVLSVICTVYRFVCKFEVTGK